MNAPFSPFDPFQHRPAGAAASIEALGRQWDDLTRQMDDDAAYKRAERAAPPFGGDVWFNRLSDEREPIEALIAANAEPTIEAIAVKLRMMAWHMRYEEGGLTGERSPTQNEKTITSALAAAERLALAHHRGEG
jgi:hypothetical protein